MVRATLWMACVVSALGCAEGNVDPAEDGDPGEVAMEPDGPAMNDGTVPTDAVPEEAPGLDVGEDRALAMEVAMPMDAVSDLPGRETPVVVDTPVAPDLPRPTGECNDGPGPRYVDPASGHCYWHLGTQSWSSAEAGCMRGRGHLMAIGSMAENRMLATQFATVLPAWTGFNDMARMRDFRWISGELVTYRNWATGRPAGMGRCVILTRAGLWEEAPCEAPYDAVCERDRP